eukprot:COSAG04_NODE_9362_length_870_cov_6.598555_2_plen_215_part_01
MGFSKKKKKGCARRAACSRVPGPILTAPRAGSGSDEEEEEEDLMGDQSWAKTDDFSAGMDDLFADMMGGQSVDDMKADLAASGVDVNASVANMGEDAAEAEAEEAAKKAAAEKEAAEQAEKDKKAAALREKRRNMSKEDKMAKMKVKPLQKKADTMKADGKLADEKRYEEALAFIEDEEWVKAEQALKDATHDPEEEARKKKEAEEEEARIKAEE